MKLLIILSVILGCAAVQAKGEVGNGGNVVICPSSKPKVELLDFEEGRNLRGIIPNLGSPQLSVMAKIDIELSRLAKISPTTAARYRVEAEQFLAGENNAPNSTAIFLPHIQLVPVADSEHAFVPAGCRAVQIVIQKKPLFKEDKRYIVSRDLWSQLDNTSKAGLVMHEIIYTDAISSPWGAQSNSIRTRYLNSYLAANKFAKMSFKATYAVEKETAILPSIVYKGAEIISYRQLKFFNDGHVEQASVVPGSTVYIYGQAAKVPIEDEINYYDDGHIQSVYGVASKTIWNTSVGRLVDAGGLLKFSDNGHILSVHSLHPQNIRFQNKLYPVVNVDFYENGNPSDFKWVSGNNTAIYNMDEGGKITGIRVLSGSLLWPTVLGALELTKNVLFNAGHLVSAKLAKKQHANYDGQNITISDTVGFFNDNKLKHLTLAEPAIFQLGDGQKLRVSGKTTLYHSGALESAYPASIDSVKNGRNHDQTITSPAGVNSYKLTLGSFYGDSVDFDTEYAGPDKFNEKGVILSGAIDTGNVLIQGKPTCVDDTSWWSEDWSGNSLSLMKFDNFGYALHVKTCKKHVSWFANPNYRFVVGPNTVQFRSGTWVGFYPNQSVRTGTLGEDITLPWFFKPYSKTFQKGDHVAFDKDGRVVGYVHDHNYIFRGTLTKNIKVKVGINLVEFESGMDFSFHKNGTVESGSLLNDSQIQVGKNNLQFMADSEVSFDRNGNLVEGTISKDIWLPYWKSYDRKTGYSGLGYKKFEKHTDLDFDNNGIVTSLAQY